MKNNLEEVWRKDFEKSLDASLKYFPKSPEDHPYDHIRWCWYYEGRKNAQEEIERLRLHHEIKINNAAQIIVTKDNDLKELKQELQKTREQLEKCEKSLMKVACFETHGENKYISHAQAYTGVANFARRYFQDKENKDEK